MNEDFQRRMTEAARLMRSGGLMEATAAIQQALGVTPSGPAPSRNDDDVIDVQARVVGEHDAPPAAESGTRPESFTAGHFRNECGARDYKLFEPARDGRPLPLVVMLHGCTQDPDDFARGTRMNALARAQGFLVLYPAQSQRANAQGCWNWFKHNHQARGKGEPAILAGMVREAIATHGVDPARVYVAGLSAGGAMAAILAEQAPDVFAAAGIMAGVALHASHDVSTAFAAMRGGVRAAQIARTAETRIYRNLDYARLRVTIWAGARDRLVVPENASVLVDQFVDLLGLEASEVVVEMREGAAIVRFADRAGRARIEAWRVNDMGHAWSGGSFRGSHTWPKGPRASDEMMAFFLDEASLKI